jgi:MSHA biogenesis protein MshL
MKRLVPFVLPIVLLGAPADPPAKADAPERISLSVHDADWKDVLRAALEHTDLNLSFDPDLDTRVEGLDLKGVTLQELLDEILPAYNLSYVRNGRSLHIMKSDTGLRFYQVDTLSMRRVGTKEFSVNSSGQVIQATGGQGGSGGGGQATANNSAYTSTLQTSNGSDPWQELQVGLASLVYGEPSLPTAAASKNPGGPQPVAYNKAGKTLLINPNSGIITVGADLGTQHRVERYLAEMQRRNRRQVLLEAKIVEVTLSSDSQMGVNWSNALLSPGASSGGVGTNVAGSFTPGTVLNPNVLPATGGAMALVVSNARFTATLSALASDGKLKVLSSPRLTALNNQKAILRVVQEQAYFLSNSTTTGAGSTSGVLSTSVNITPVIVPIGIVLDIQPQIGDDGGIILAVNPSVSDVASVASFTSGSAATGMASANLPVVNRRDLDTVAHLWSGETLILAGIIKTTENDTDRGVPWLRNIPFLGALFTQREKSKSQTELAIFITATLMEDGIQIDEEHRHAADRVKKAGVELDPEPQATPSRKLP